MDNAVVKRYKQIDYDKLRWKLEMFTCFYFAWEISSTFAFTLLSPAMLMNDYKTILTSKLQSDSVERGCSQYRQIGDGRSLIPPEKS